MATSWKKYKLILFQLMKTNFNYKNPGNDFLGSSPLQYYIIVHIKGVTAIMSKLHHELKVTAL